VLEEGGKRHGKQLLLERYQHLKNEKEAGKRGRYAKY
jgi:hypothetical protein